MKNLKRFRSWIALVAAVTWNYLQQLGTSRSSAAEDCPDNAAPQTSSSQGAVTERHPGQVASKPSTVPKSGATTVQSKAGESFARVPTVQTTVDVAPANGKAHESAQRLARVLISEIKLYYLDKIDGQDASEVQNIYDLLKDPIDKSRQHYKQRVGAEASASMPDYFHGELVKTLCEGDASRLGPNYSTK
jgi:hypothetical protein